jgi:hypothetical protein
VEQRRLSAGRVFQYRLLHAEFGGQAQRRPQSSETSAETPVAVPAASAMAICARRHLPGAHEGNRRARAAQAHGARAARDAGRGVMRALEQRLRWLEEGPVTPKPHRAGVEKPQRQTLVEADWVYNSSKLGPDIEIMDHGLAIERGVGT